MKLDALTLSRRPLSRRSAAARADAAPIGWFESAPGWLFYAPVVLQWIALGLWHRDMSLPSAANPCIEAGGLCGESKSAILDQLPNEARGLVAPHATFVTASEPDRDADHAAAAGAMARAALAFPLVAKPDIGCNGTGVRLVADRAALDAYVASFPRGRRIMLQAYVAYEHEAGLFYVRLPGETRGRITSVTLKHAPYVVGDGRRSLAELVRADPRYRYQVGLLLPHLGDRANTVPATGERVRLVFVGNHCKGSVFENGAREATAALSNAVGRFAATLPEFHFGRIDVRFESPGALRRGTGFTVIEVNGAGSEATHIWDPTTRLVDAMRAQLWHFGAAWRIGAANRRRGYRATGLPDLFRSWRMQRRLMASYPTHD